MWPSDNRATTASSTAALLPRRAISTLSTMVSNRPAKVFWARVGVEWVGGDTGNTLDRADMEGADRGEVEHHPKGRHLWIGEMQTSRPGYRDRVADDSGILALHVGGSKFSAGVVSHEGDIVLRDRVPATGRDPWTVISGLLKRIRAAADGFDLSGCGVSINGPIEVKSGTVAPLNIPTWKEFPLADSVADLTGLRTVVDTEAKALARGEAWVGAVRGEADFLAVYVGSSVSSGIVSGGQVLDGNFGNAGFIGHVLVEDDGRPCRCGGRGCLEAYVSARAIEAETGRSPAYASPVLIERNALYVGRAIASALAVLDVPKVVLGGSVAAAWGEPFFEAVVGEVRSRTRLEFTRGVDILPASLGDYGVLIGAAALTRSQLGASS